MIKNESSKFINKYLKALGLNLSEAKILTLLLQNSEKTVLEISREVNIERTKCYRVIEKFLKRGLITQRIDYKKRFFKAIAPEQLKVLVDQQIEQAEFIKKSYNIFLNLTNNHTQKMSPTQVRFFRGKEGIKQVLWNELSARKIIRTFSYRNLMEVVSRKFFKLWAREIENRKLKVHDLRSAQFIESDQLIAPEFFLGDIVRYIPPEKLDIITEIDIYNNTVVIFNWYEGDIFAVEIENEKLAKMQKQMFDSFWKEGEPHP